MVTAKLSGGPLNGRIVKLALGQELRVPHIKDTTGNTCTVGEAIYRAPKWECELL
jgi:hypothetical protein